MSNEVTGNLFFTTKGGFKAHVQIKESVDEGTNPDSILTLLSSLEEGIVQMGGKAEQPFVGSTKAAGGSTGGQKAQRDLGDGQCPNGCGKRPWVEAGVSKKTGKPYNAFWGECRTCGFKGS